ncbi:MAG: 2-oxoisovalerate ferredoxin oxidoreductase, beta subunit [bacterium]|nr:MAG: 2-oxoisovalerate ferredoxin oxidoreductase, beta subunit [bacterium]
MSVFYETFERHAHGEGLKGRSTHYCPGCGHGLAHKYLAESIDELGIQDRTVAISPVGCSVFLYYYFDVGNSQAAHGRAPAVALGHKFANPEAVVISYQGDGDLASIGLAETVSAAQLGVPITVIFINNAIYGMTGGQMAPTSLMGQKTSTSPTGREQVMGQPLRMAELIAGLDGPIYVERVALFSARQRMLAKRAIKKAVNLQVEGRGYSFIEVLAECPTHLRLTPEEAERWVKDEMRQIFPLGVKKDATVEPWFKPVPPSFSPEQLWPLVGGTTDHPGRSCTGFPHHVAPHDIATRALTPRTFPVTAPSRGAAPPTRMFTWRRRRSSRRPRPCRTSWWRSMPRAWPSSARRWPRAARSSTTVPSWEPAHRSTRASGCTACRSPKSPSASAV